MLKTLPLSPSLLPSPCYYFFARYATALTWNPLKFLKIPTVRFQWYETAWRLSKPPIIMRLWWHEKSWSPSKCLAYSLIAGKRSQWHKSSLKSLKIRGLRFWWYDIVWNPYSSMVYDLNDTKEPETLLISGTISMNQSPNQTIDLSRCCEPSQTIKSMNQ